MTDDASKTRSTRFAVEIAASPEAVWKALTDAREVARWFPMKAEVIPGPGGDVLWAWGDAWSWRHRIDVWEPPRLLRLVQDVPERFDADGNAVKDTSTGEPMALELTLGARSGTTALTLVHSGFGHGAAWDDEMESTTSGWTYELSILKLYLEAHAGQDRHVAWATASTPLAQDEDVAGFEERARALLQRLLPAAASAG